MEVLHRDDAEAFRLDSWSLPVDQVRLQAWRFPHERRRTDFSDAFVATRRSWSAFRPLASLSVATRKIGSARSWTIRSKLASTTEGSRDGVVTAEGRSLTSFPLNAASAQIAGKISTFPT